MLLFPVSKIDCALTVLAADVYQQRISGTDGVRCGRLYVGNCQGTHSDTNCAGDEHTDFEPSSAGQQCNGRQRNRHLQYGGGLRPAVVLVHFCI